MTVGNILEAFDAFKENDFSDQVKIAWIGDVEGRVLCEIHKMSPDMVTLPKSSEDNVTLSECDMRTYLLYMSAMLELARGDFAAHSKISEEFEAAFHIYAKRFIRNRS